MQKIQSGESYHNSKQATLRIFYSYHRVATEAINDVFVTGTLLGEHWYLVTEVAGQRMGPMARTANPSRWDRQAVPKVDNPIQPMPR
jgi:hypothetical protein